MKRNVVITYLSRKEKEDVRFDRNRFNVSLNSPKWLKVQKFDVFREILRIPNTSDEEKRRIYISFAEIEGGCSFRLKSIQRFSKQPQMAESSRI